MFLFAPALGIMMVSIFLQGGNFQGGNNNVMICNPDTHCVSTGTTTVITCTAPIAACQITPLPNDPAGTKPYCINNVPPPAWCFPWPASLISPGTFLGAGETIVLNSTIVNSAHMSSSIALFGFGSIGGSGWITMILIATGLVCLASIAVLGTGMGNEGVHILAISGVVLGLWGFLSAMDGFILGNSTSLFSLLNQFVIGGATGFGTILYILCSLLWVFGWLGSFTWGS